MTLLLGRIGEGWRSSAAFVALTSGALVLSPLGCGRTRTSLGDSRASDSGGNLGSAGQGAGNSAGSGAGGEVGSGGVGEGGAGAGGTPEDAGPQGCNVPRPPPDPNPTPEQRERAALIRDACQALTEQDCRHLLNNIGTISRSLRGCSLAEHALACEQDALVYVSRQIEAACEQQWRALIACEIEANRTPGNCVAAGALAPMFSEPNPCPAERDAYDTCSSGQRGPFVDVTGSRGTCRYSYPSTFGKCSVGCAVGRNLFSGWCDVVPGVAAECHCSVNSRDLGDDVDGVVRPFYASDCQDAAQRMANGECIERLDCCFTYPGPGGAEFCACTADPALGGWSSCEVAAGASGGKVVEICPQYVGPNCRPDYMEGCR
jgi:hypothetical protein